MYNASNSTKMIIIYETQARTLTVVHGNSGVIYPFYKSSGQNSGLEGIWAPWMGYFERHPKASNQIYMAKPDTFTLSKELKDIIEQHCTKAEATSLFLRMGNDEALAISCSLGGGVWAERPKFCEEIKNAACIKPYIKQLDIHHFEKAPPLPAMTKEEAETLVNFKGKKFKGKTMRNQAEMATIMEKITSQESARVHSSKKFTYPIQDRKVFPTTKQLQTIAYDCHGLAIRTNYYHRLGLFKKDNAVISDKNKGPAKDQSLPNNNLQG